MRGPAPLEGDSPSCAVASCFWLRTPPRVSTRSKGPGPRARGVLERSWTLYVENSLRWRELPKPTIASVQGYCIYGGS